MGIAINPGTHANRPNNAVRRAEDMDWVASMSCRVMLLLLLPPDSESGCRRRLNGM